MATWGGDTFQPILSSIVLTNKANHREQKEDLPDKPFLPLGEVPGGLRANLAHPDFLTYGGILTKRRYPVVNVYV